MRRPGPPKLPLGRPDRPNGSECAKLEELLKKRLRHDLRIKERPLNAAGGMRFKLKNPATGEIFDLGEEEIFLAMALGSCGSVEEVLASFHDRFGIELNEAGLGEFVALLDSFGILEDAAPGGSAGTAERAAGAGTFAGDQTDESANPGTKLRSPPPPQVGRRRINLVDPDRGFRLLARVFRPLRFALWLIVPAALLAAVAVLNEQTSFISSTRAIFGTINFLQHIVISLFTVNLLAKIVQGVAMAHSGLRVHQFGLRLALGVIPRFYTERAQIEKLEPRERMRCYAAPLITKLGLCAFAILFWAVTHKSGSGMAVPALVLGQIAFGSLLFTANPLWPADGYRWLAARFDMPELRQQAFRLLRLKLSGRRVPEGMGKSEGFALTAFGLSSFLYTIALVALLFMTAAISLERQHNGTGVVIALAIAAMFTTFVYASWKRRGLMRQTGATGFSPLATEPRAGDRGADLGPALPGDPGGRDLALRRRHLDQLIEPRRRQKTPRSRIRTFAFWTIALVVMAIVAVQPYRLEVGGDLVIQPTKRVEVRARTDGEILKVLVKEGDWVEKDQVLAVLSDWNEKRDVAVTSDELAKARATLQTLEAGAKPEEIKEAEQKIESARVEVEYAQKQRARTKTLLDKGISSRKQMDIDLNRHESARAKLAEAEAKLELVKSGARTSEIEAARAEVQRLEHLLDFRRAELERTRIRALQAGQIVTPRVALKLGAYLPVGGLFSELEDNRVARAEIEVPKADIEDVRVGAQVRIKAWSGNGGLIIGQVVSKSPKAEERPFGKIVRVTIEIPNADGRLRTSMTGYGKIQVGEQPVWKAFSRTLVRFFAIEMWSWLP